MDEVVQNLESTKLEDEPEAAQEPSQSQGYLSSHGEETTDEKDFEPLNVEPTPVKDEDSLESYSPPSNSASEEESGRPRTHLYEDPSDEEDGEGEWITPDNVALHKSKALDLLPDDGLGSKKKKDEITDVGCMTADFAMQNVLLQMGLNLVGLEGRRIEKVKTWVLRCHACFK